MGGFCVTKREPKRIIRTINFIRLTI